MSVSHDIRSYEAKHSGTPELLGTLETEAQHALIKSFAHDLLWNIAPGGMVDLEDRANLNAEALHISVYENLAGHCGNILPAFDQLVLLLTDKLWLILPEAARTGHGGDVEEFKLTLEEKLSFGEDDVPQLGASADYVVFRAVLAHAADDARDEFPLDELVEVACEALWSEEDSDQTAARGLLLLAIDQVVGMTV